MKTFNTEWNAHPISRACLWTIDGKQITNVHTHPMRQAGEGTVPPASGTPFLLYSGFLLSLPF